MVVVGAIVSQVTGSLGASLPPPPPFGESISVVTIPIPLDKEGEGEKEEFSGDSTATPSSSASIYQQLIQNNNDTVSSILTRLNRTPLGPLQSNLSLYYNSSEQEAIAFCEDHVKNLLNGSLTHTKDGCDLTVQCTYKEGRFPPLLLNGMCGGNRPQYCGKYPELKKCVTQDVRVPILNYQETTDGYRLTGEKDLSQKEWVEGRVTLTTDCLCEA